MSTPDRRSHAVEIEPGWHVAGRPHGGYLLRLAAELALDADHPHPLAVSGHFLSSPDAGPASVTVERRRTGRRVASTATSLSSAGQTRLDVLVTAGTLTGEPPRWSSPGGPLDLPPLADCPRLPSATPTGATVGYLDQVDLRLDPATTRWAYGEPQQQAVTAGWVRRGDGADADPLDLLVFADASPPVTFDLGLFGWAPTLELTVHLRGLPGQAGCGCSSGPGCCRAVGWTRSASCGTATTGWSRRPASWPATARRERRSGHAAAIRRYGDTAIRRYGDTAIRRHLSCARVERHPTRTPEPDRGT